MRSGRKIRIVYVTSSEYKKQEAEVFLRSQRLSDGRLAGDLFTFDIRKVKVQEILEMDIERMVCEEVKSAYHHVRVPCIVEHAGLIFSKYRAEQYPGGLTKPMWTVLGTAFLAETQSAGSQVIARAVVAYTDGMVVRTFVGERPGTLAVASRGSRSFYWDPVFIPDDPAGRSTGKTYAEIVDDPALGLQYKLELSQSSAAMKAFLEYRLENPPALWGDRG